MLKTEKRRVNVGLPTRPFLYTLDQVATLVQVNEQELRKNYLHFVGVDSGVPKRDRMQANDIGTLTGPDWRISERELCRWLVKKGFRLTERDWEV